MKIGAAKTEGTHTGAARMIGAREPRAFLRVDVERGFAGRRFIKRLFHLDRGRQNLVLQRLHGLDQPCHAGGRLGVADLGFHRTERRPSAFGFRLAEDLGDGAQFGGITHLGAGAVRLDQFHRVRRDASPFVGPLDGFNLAFGTWFVDRSAATITG